MDTNLDAQEQRSLDAISHFVKEKIRSKVNRTIVPEVKHIPEEHKRPMPEAEIEHFWEECIKIFLKQMKDLFGKQAEKLVDKESEESRLSWSNAIDDFKEAYYEAKEESIVLGYTKPKKINKIDSAFDLIVKELTKEHKISASWEELVFGRMHFDKLVYLLDLQDEEIRKLLPYLLTAYTCNSRTNGFLCKKEPKGVIKALISSDYSLADSTDAAKLVHSSKRLKEVFSLSQYQKKRLCLSDQEKVDHDVPAPLIWSNVLDEAYHKEVRIPLIRYKELAVEIFKCWCSAIQEAKFIAETGYFPQDIDWKMCCALFNHYCADGEQNEPGK